MAVAATSGPAAAGLTPRRNPSPTLISRLSPPVTSTNSLAEGGNARTADERNRCVMQANERRAARSGIGLEPFQVEFPRIIEDHGGASVFRLPAHPHVSQGETLDVTGA